MSKYNYTRTRKIDKQIIKYEIEHIYLKFLIYNQKDNGLKIIGLLILQLLKNHKRYAALSRFQNRCLITYSKKSVYRQFYLTRMKLKEFGLVGIIPGLRKSSW